MLKIFIGTALTLLNYDYSWNFGGQPHMIGIIPHFLGFFIIMFGIRDMKKESDYFDRVELPTYIMIVYSLAYYLTKAFGLIYTIRKVNEYIVYMMDIAEAIGTFLVAYLLIFAISNMEHRKRYDIGCVKMQKWFKITAFAFILYYIAYITNTVMGDTQYVAATVRIALIFNTVRSVITVIYLFLFYQMWARYMEQRR